MIGIKLRRELCRTIHAAVDIANSVQINDLACAHLLLADQRVDVQRQEEAVQQVIGQNVIQELAVDDEDVVQVVQVIQVLRHQVTQLPPVLMPEEIKLEYRRSDTIFIHHRQSSNLKINNNKCVFILNACEHVGLWGMFSLFEVL